MKNFLQQLILQMFMFQTETIDGDVYEECIPNGKILVCNKRVIGRGSNGLVYRGRYDRIWVAVCIKPRNPENEKYIKDFQDNVAIKSDKITQYYHTEKDETQIFFATSLWGKSIRKKYAEGVRFNIAKTLCEAVRDLHQKKIKHGSINLDKILADENGVVKLADYGEKQIMELPKEEGEFLFLIIHS